MNEGTTLGAYRIVKRIGAGGMGEVWLAEHTLLGRRAAIKVLHPQYSSRQDVVTRFFNEAKAATAIADPGIVQIFDFGHHSDGSAYIVMELLEGEPLEDRLRRMGRLPIGGALRIMRQVASSLGAAHARGVVHRDLKPDNLFLVRDHEVAGGERAKILDFGIAKLTDSDAVKTQTQAVMGTPTYMSPEQCRGAGYVDRRSDVYSLGCVLFHLIVGGPPFDGEGAGDLIAQHLREPAPAASTRVDGVPREVEALVQRCMEKDPNKRFAGGLELAAAIGELLTIPAIANAAAALPRSPLPGAASTGMPGFSPTLAPGGEYQSVTVASGTDAGAFAAAGAVAPAAYAAAPSAAGPLPQTVPPRSRTALYAAVGLVVVVGSGFGIWKATGTHAAPAPQPAGVGDAVPVTPGAAPSHVAVASADAVDPELATASDKISALLQSFRFWSPSHGGAACPTTAELGATSAQGIVDPWGQTLTVTCTEQPDGQAIGVSSSGPDRQAGTADDLHSWQLGSAAQLATGPRWVATGAMPGLDARTSSLTHHASPAGKPATPTDAKQPRTAVPAVEPAKPAVEPAKPAPPLVDENGIPLRRRSGTGTGH